MKMGVNSPKRKTLKSAKKKLYHPKKDDILEEK
jgi:hypothetical protein